ncbi:hypothetical protein CRUP_009680, partial [Coryphaenoides rupestris]
ELEVELRVEQEGGGGRGGGEAGLPTNGGVLLYDPGADQQEQQGEVENVMVMEVVQQQIPRHAGRKSRQVSSGNARVKRSPILRLWKGRAYQDNVQPVVIKEEGLGSFQTRRLPVQLSARARTTAATQTT